MISFGPIAGASIAGGDAPSGGPGSSSPALTRSARVVARLAQRASIAAALWLGPEILAAPDAPRLHGPAVVVVAPAKPAAREAHRRSRVISLARMARTAAVPGPTLARMARVVVPQRPAEPFGRTVTQLAPRRPLAAAQGPRPLAAARIVAGVVDRDRGGVVEWLAPSVFSAPDTPTRLGRVARVVTPQRPAEPFGRTVTQLAPRKAAAVAQGPAPRPAARVVVPQRQAEPFGRNVTQLAPRKVATATPSARILPTARVVLAAPPAATSGEALWLRPGMRPEVPTRAGGIDALVVTRDRPRTTRPVQWVRPVANLAPAAPAVPPDRLAVVVGRPLPRDTGSFAFVRPRANLAPAAPAVPPDRLAVVVGRPLPRDTGSFAFVRPRANLAPAAPALTAPRVARVVGAPSRGRTFDGTVTPLAPVRRELAARVGVVDVVTSARERTRLATAQWVRPRANLPPAAPAVPPDRLAVVVGRPLPRDTGSVAFVRPRANLAPASGRARIPALRVVAPEASSRGATGSVRWLVPRLRLPALAPGLDRRALVVAPFPRMALSPAVLRLAPRSGLTDAVAVFLEFRADGTPALWFTLADGTPAYRFAADGHPAVRLVYFHPDEDV